MLVWPQSVCLQQVVVECAGSSVGAQLLDPGLSELCHTGDCLMGLKNHVGKRKQYGKFVLPGLLGHMSCGSGSGLGSTQYTRHRHHYLPTPLQPVGDKQFAAIQALENIFCPDIPHQTTQEPTHTKVEPPETALSLQQIQQSTSVDLSTPLQEQPGSNLDGHRYPKRYSLSKNHPQWLAPANTLMQLNT